MCSVSGVDYCPLAVWESIALQAESDKQTRICLRSKWVSSKHAFQTTTVFIVYILWTESTIWLLFLQPLTHYLVFLIVIIIIDPKNVKTDKAPQILHQGARSLTDVDLGY